MSEIDSKWKWQTCNFPLKRLSSNSNFLSLNQLDQNNKLAPIIDIDMNRYFDHDNKNGWNWHKSWILPSFTVTIENPNFSEIGFKDDFYIEILAVTENIEKSGEKYLNELHLIGKNKILIKSSMNKNFYENKFTALKFGSTTYNNDKKKFRLLVIVYTQKEILGTKISPSIYVDSRKSARDCTQKDSDVLKMYEPEMNEKSFFKKKKSEKLSSDPEKITSDLEGLISYYTAPNIRNKIKHPYFLGIRFFECVTLYYNESLFKNLDSKEIIYKILEIINYSSDSENKKDKSFPKAKNQNLLTILIKSSIKINYIEKTIMKLIGKSTETRFVKFVFDEKLISSNFIEFPPRKTIIEVYKKAYDKFVEYPIDELKKKRKIEKFLDKDDEKILNKDDTVISQNEEIAKIPIPLPLEVKTEANQSQLNSQINDFSQNNNFNNALSSFSSLINLKAMMEPSNQFLWNMYYGMHNRMLINSPNHDLNMLPDIYNPFNNNLAWMKFFPQGQGKKENEKK